MSYLGYIEVESKKGTVMVIAVDSISSLSKGTSGSTIHFKGEERAILLKSSMEGVLSGMKASIVNSGNKMCVSEVLNLN